MQGLSFPIRTWVGQFELLSWLPEVLSQQGRHWAGPLRHHGPAKA